MTPLYAYSLVPVLSVSLLLFSTAVLRGRRSVGLAAFCATIALWSGSLLSTYLPEIAWIGRRTSASGAFVAASYLHAAYEFTERDDYRLVWLAYAFAAAVTLAGVARPGLLYDPVTFSAGPLFWPAMGTAIVAATIPLWELFRAYREATDDQMRREIQLLVASGVMCYVGAWSNATLLSYGWVLPYGIFLVLGSLLVLARVVQRRQRRRDRRMMERSLLYAALAALLSAGFLFGIVTLMSEGEFALLTEYRLGALFLLFMAALAFEPVRQHLQTFLGRRLADDERTAAPEIADELAEQEQRADHHERLAELGTFTSAIAHEVRNPLGVIAGCIRVLEHRDVDPETVEEMRQQIDRASQFLDDLLAYGRPRSLEIRSLEIADLVDLALSSTRRDLGDTVEEVPVEREGLAELPEVEADQSQLTEVFVVLLENAILELQDVDEPRIRVTGRHGDETVTVVVEDNGSGLPDEIRSELFEPFVTGRKRDGPRTGTGLGLAIARNVVDRHGGELRAETGESLGGARFVLELPIDHDVLAAATRE